MPSITRFASLILLIIGFSVLAAGCGKTAAEQSHEAPIYTSFRDVPGITHREIADIEALQKRHSSFSYGMTLSTEAFIKDGKVSGYTAMLCDWLTTLFGIRFEPAIYLSNETIEKLDSREIDFLGNFRITDERMEHYFMTDAIADRRYSLLRLPGSRSLSQILQERPLKYALMEGFSTPETESWLESIVNCRVTWVKNSEEVWELLKNREIDGFLGVNVSEAAYDSVGQVTAETFYPLLFSAVAMVTANPELEPIISVVNKAIRNGGRSYMTSLYSQGYQDYIKYKFSLALTDEEREYIKNHQAAPIPVVANFDNYPICFYNTRHHEWQGVFFDLMDKIASLTGMSFAVDNENDSDWPVVYEKVKSGEAALIAALVKTKDREEFFIWPKTAMQSDYYALISSTDHRDIEFNEIMDTKIGLAEGTAYTAIFRQWFPEHKNNIEYETMDAAIRALRRGEVDMVMATQRRLLLLTHYQELPGYKANLVFDQPLETVMGFNKNEAILCSIIDKALAAIDAKVISERWLRKTYDYQRKMMEIQFPWLIGTLILFWGVLALVIIFFMRSRHTGKKLEKIVSERTSDLNMQTSVLMTIFDSSPDFIFCKDLHLRYTRCNKSMEDFLDISLKDMVGKSDMEVFGFSHDVAEGYIKDDQNVIESKQPIVLEETIESQSGGGKKLMVETVKTPLVQNGKVIGIMGISRDITKRKATENELAMQTTKLRTILGAIPDFIFCKDLNLNFTQLNNVMEEFYGVREEDVLGKSDIGFLGFPEDIMEQALEVEKDVIRDNKKSVIEEKIKHRDGITRIWETSRVPLKQDDATVGILTITREVTKRKEMEEAALLASRSKSAFLANMSHEIRTPMNSIVGFSELALDCGASPKIKDFLGKILDNANGLLLIINDILDISKVESGKMELECIPFDIHELFNSCRTLILPKAAEKDITLYFYAEPSINKKPLGDPTRLRQVLVNLLSNAIKFTNTGMVKLNASLVNKTDEYITIHFEVKDSGIGMTPRQMEVIFDPFIQAESGTTRKYGGTGLGLTITKSIVELMGGELSVTSAPGVGSKFSFDIAFETIDINDADLHEKKIVYNDLKKPKFEGEVLLCEDNMMNQEVICEHLTRVGLRTVIAENGKIGVMMVKDRMQKGEKQFDLIFMDIHMPVMDGIEASTKIQELNTGVPIVAMTANIMSNDMEIYRKSGMKDCIGKPFTSQELWVCLMKFFVPINKVAVHSVTQNEAPPQEEDASQDEDQKFRQKLQMIFLKDNRQKYEEVTQALEAGDIKLAHRLVHSLKSNAGQLGKTLLQQAAGTVEMALEGGTNQAAKGQLKILETELNAVIAELEQLTGTPSRQAAEAQVDFLDAESALKLLEKLEPMLEMGNPDSMEMIESLQRIQGSGELIQRMEKFDFEPAMAMLAELKSQIAAM